MAITVVQGTPKATGGSGPSIACVFATPPVVAHGIIVFVNVWRNTGLPVPDGCTDNFGNTYVRVSTQANAQGATALFYCAAVVATGASFTVTVTSTTASFWVAKAVECSGGLVVDQFVGATGVSATPATGPTAALTGTDVLQSACHVILGSHTSITVGIVTPPWVQEFEELPSTIVAGEADTRSVSAAAGTTPSCSWTDTAVSSWAAVLVAFKAAAPPPPLSTYQTRVLADGASAYWPLDDPAGSTAARDLAGTRHAPIAGPVTVNQPGIGSSRAMTFAVPGQLLPPSLPVAAPAITLEAWGYTTTPSGSNMGIITAEIFFGGEYIWERRDDLPTTFRLTYHNGTAVLTFSVTVPPAPTLGAWVHMAVSASVAMGVQFYVQGVPIGTAQALAAMGGPGGGPRALAAFHDDPRSWIGSLQDIAIYPRVLTATEISQHYTLRLTPDVPPAAPVSTAQARGRTDAAGTLKVSTVTAGALGPPLAFSNTRVRMNADGSLVTTTTTPGALGPRVALTNARVRTDATGALLVAVVAAGALGPIVNLANARVRTDANGALLVAAATAGALGPAVALPNLRVRTDVNGALVVAT